MSLHLRRLFVLASLILLDGLAAVAGAQARYTATRKGEVVELADARRHAVVSILPSVGNMAISFTINGQDVLRWPYQSVEEFKARPGLSGIPFIAPWANRLDEQAFYANGTKYNFDMGLGNVRGTIPIHGFLTTNDRWKVDAVRADARSAWITSTLEFYREPTWMKQFPFAHVIRMTYRLEDGVLQVTTRIENLSNQPMPVSIGFHPYFQLTDSMRDEWTLSVGARTQWLLAPNKIPTGETRPIDQFFPDPTHVALKDFDLDHVFSDLVRDATGRAIVSIRGRQQQIDVIFGPNYRAAVLYSPVTSGRGRGGEPARGFMAIEPMAGITDAMNLANNGLYKDLQSVAPGGVWQESFWVRPTGF